MALNFAALFQMQLRIASPSLLRMMTAELYVLAILKRLDLFY